MGPVLTIVRRHDGLTPASGAEPGLVRNGEAAPPAPGDDPRDASGGTTIGRAAEQASPVFFDTMRYAAALFPEFGTGRIGNGRGRPMIW
jgi:hypothetical protein